MSRKGIQSREDTQERKNLKILEIKSWCDVKSDRLLFENMYDGQWLMPKASLPQGWRQYQWPQDLWPLLGEGGTNFVTILC